MMIKQIKQMKIVIPVNIVPKTNPSIDIISPAKKNPSNFDMNSFLTAVRTHQVLATEFRTGNTLIP